MKRILFILSLLFSVQATANISIVNTAFAAGNIANKKTVSTTAMSTSGCSLICVGVEDFQGGAAGTLTDNQGNTWTLIRTNNDGAVARVRVYYCNAPTTNASHTFTYTSAADVYPSIHVYALAGTKASSPLDQQNGTGLAAATSGQPGSITPTENGEIVLSFVNSQGGIATPAAPTLNTPTNFTRIGPIDFLINSHFACASAYWIQGSAAATNQQWNYPGSWSSAIIQVSFKPDSYTPTTVEGGAFLWHMLD